MMTMLQNVGIALRPPHLPPRKRSVGRRWWIIVLAVVVAALLVLGAAWVGSLAPVDKSDLIGTWTSTNGDTTTTLVVHKDGSVHASNLQAKDVLLSFDGTWTTAGDQIVVKTIKPVRDKQWSITLHTQRSLYQPQLVNYPGGAGSQQGEQVFFHQ